MGLKKKPGLHQSMGRATYGFVARHSNTDTSRATVGRYRRLKGSQSQELSRHRNTNQPAHVHQHCDVTFAHKHVVRVVDLNPLFDDFVRLW